MPLLLAGLVMRTRKINLKSNWPDLAVVMFTGMYGLIAVIIIEPEV